MSEQATGAAALPTTFKAPSVWRLALRQLWRDWRAGELRLLGLAVLLAVAAATAVGFLSDRLDRGLKRDAAQLLGGDVVVASDQPTPAPLEALAAQHGLTLSRTVTFPSMARLPEDLGGDTRLVSVKAVDDNYPLRGQVKLSEPPAPKSRQPQPGEVWVDPALMQALSLKLGDTLWLGDSEFAVAGVIDVEPDRGAGFMNFAPRVMLNRADLAATGLIQPASRVTYRLAGMGPQARDFAKAARAAIEQQAVRGVRLESLEANRSEMQQTLDRAGKFLRLVAMLSALLAAVAVALAARDFAARHLDDCAMLRVLGQPQRRIAAVYALEFLLAGLLAAMAGVLVGLIAQQGFVALLSGLVSADLPAPGAMPALLGLGLGLALLAGFGLPPVLQLAAVPAIRVIRRDFGAPRASGLIVGGLGVAGLAGVLALIADDWMLGGITLAGFAIAAGVFALLARLCVALLRRSLPRGGSAAAWPRWLLLATRQVSARPGLAVVEVTSLSLGLLALALLVLLRTDLIDAWRSATPAQAPNRFVINIQPDQAEAFRSTLTQAGVKDFDWYPMFRGRLSAINGQPLKLDSYTDPQARRLAEREFNLSHSARLPSHNQVTGGQWVDDEAGGLSVEAGLAKTLGLKLGDSLRFDVAGQALEARVTSLRKVEWSSMRVNFFVIIPQAQLGNVPTTQIAAYRVPGDAAATRELDRRMAREFPNITAIDVTAQLDQVQGVVNQVIQAVQALFLFTLATGLIVLLAALASTREARAREFALMRALGAQARLLRQVQRAELLGVGLLAGVLAGASATVISALLARRVFDFAWQPSPLPFALTAMTGAALTLLAGWWLLRGVLQRPVVASLRAATTE